MMEQSMVLWSISKLPKIQFSDSGLRGHLHGIDWVVILPIASTRWGILLFLSLSFLNSPWSLKSCAKLLPFSNSYQQINSLSPPKRLKAEDRYLCYWAQHNIQEEEFQSRTFFLWDSTSAWASPTEEFSFIGFRCQSGLTGHQRNSTIIF